METGDGESLIQRQPGQALSPGQERVLRELAAALRKDWDPFRLELHTCLQQDRPARRRMLMQVADEKRLAFTETAWAWIDAEDDLEILDLLLCLMAAESNAQLLCNLRRALFEHRDLCNRLRSTGFLIRAPLGTGG